ncbi:MAG: LamG domain-containing protein [Polyangiaceae bacterium]
MRRVLAWTIAAGALAGCSLFVSLDDLSGGALDGDSGTVDAADAGLPFDASGDAQESDAGDASTQTYEEAVLSDSPVAYWRLGDPGPVAFDKTSNHVDGTYNSAATPGHAGLITQDSDTAVAVIDGFDGGTITIPANALLEPVNALTVEVWFRPGGSTAIGEIVSYGPQLTPPFQPWDLQINQNGAIRSILFYTASVGTLESTTNIEAGQTYYVAGTYDGFNLRLYVNGALDATGGNTGALGNYDHEAGLGIGSGFLGAFPFTGVVDEVAVYDHVLSPERIAAHYAAGAH